MNGAANPNSTVHSTATMPTIASVHAALEATLSRHFGRLLRVECVDRRILEYSTSFTLQELAVTLDGGERLSILLKDLSWRSLLPSAAGVRPRFLYNPAREIGVYQHVLSPRDWGTATCYGSLTDGAEDRHWLFLEHVRSAAQLCHVGDLAAWTHAARWLARMHATFAGGSRVPAAVPVLRYDEPFYRLWLRRAQAVAAARPYTATFLPLLARIADRYDSIIERLCGMEQTFIHGEFYASNILVDERADAVDRDTGPRICPVDWEMAAIGPGLFDLAALTAGDWSDEDRDAIVDAYRKALLDLRATVLPRSDLIRSLEACRLHAAIQWIGWSADWSAPPHQAQDWMFEASSAADRLGL